tara:strand:- start:874 stop:1296 length:423 start_codon:yes stop_codon:yes gene_type:complete
MNQGIEILLARMDSHPDEFILSDFSNNWYDGKWSMVIRGLLNRGWLLEAEAAGESVAKDYISAVPFLSDGEVLTVHRKFMSLQAGAFTASVLRTLLDEPEKDVNPSTILYPSPSQHATFTSVFDAYKVGLGVSGGSGSAI